MKISTKNIFIINNSGSKDPWSKNTHKNENAAYSEKKLAFKGIYYSYWIPPLYQKKLSFQTNMMRDIVVKYVPEYIQKRFPKEKINKFELFCGASSFGHEPVSVQMLLAENKQISNLAYPMKAVELNPVASDIASKGILEITDGDFQKILQVIKNPSKYINLCKESNPEVIDEYKKLLGLKNSKAICKGYKSFEKDGNIFLDKKMQSVDIENFDLVIFRPDPPVDLDYINATFILDFVDKSKTLILNDTKSIRDFNEKMHANLFVEFMPANIVSADKEEITSFLKEQEEIILKPLNRCFGSGVMYLKKGDKNTSSIINTMTNNQTTLTMVQKYIDNAKFGDKRVMILNGEVIEECVMKLPTGDDFKFNTHSDEFIKKATLTQSEKIKFKQVAQKLKEMGIYMAGLDVVDEQIIEVNVTSPCYFIKEVNNFFSVNLEKTLVDGILNIYGAKNDNNVFVNV